MEGYDKKKRLIVNVVYYLMIGIAAFGVCKYVLPALVPFLIAFLIAALIQIPIKKIGGRSGAKKKAAAICLSGLFYVVFFTLVIILGVKLLEVIGNLLVSVPDMYDHMIAPVLGEIADMLKKMTESVDVTMAQGLEDTFNKFSQNVGQYITNFSVNAVKMLSEGIIGIPGFFVKLVVTVVSTFFMAADFDRIFCFFKKFIPEEKPIGKTVGYVKKVIGIYVKSYIFLFLLTFMELCIGFLILKIPYAAALALAIAIFDILPVLGTGGILLPWAAVLIFMGNTPLGIGVLILYIVITIIRNTIEPKIVGKQIGLHPLATLIVMFVGLKIMGIVGMIVFPITLSVIVNLEEKGLIHIWKKKRGIN